MNGIGLIVYKLFDKNKKEIRIKTNVPRKVKNGMFTNELQKLILKKRKIAQIENTKTALHKVLFRIRMIKAASLF